MSLESRHNLEKSQATIGLENLLPARPSPSAAARGPCRPAGPPQAAMRILTQLLAAVPAFFSGSYPMEPQLHGLLFGNDFPEAFS